jgi:hypothetical protein
MRLIIFEDGTKHAYVLEKAMVETEKQWDDKGEEEAD